MLIPVIRPDKLRYRILHNQLDLVLSSALRSRSDIVVARVTVPLEAPSSRPRPSPSPAEAEPADPAPSPVRPKTEPGVTRS